MENCIKIDKFHTFSIKKYYISKIEPKDITKRMLLLSYLQISSLKYRTEEDIVRLSEKLYDFNFSVKYDQHGTYWMIAFQGNAIHPKYIKDSDYTMDEIFQAFFDLSTPLIIDSKMDKKTFQRAKKLLKASILKLEKYPSAKATSWALRTFFKDTIRDYSIRGDIEELKKITIEDLYEYYLKFKESEEGTFLVGDFDTIPYEFNNTLKVHNDHNFIERAKLDKDIYFYPYKSKQMNLRIIYDAKIFTGDDRIYPLGILNYYLGGSSYSHLFSIVREKYGLCYSISSDYFGASGIIMISSEIKKKNLDIVLEKIDEAIDTLLDNLDLEKIKRVLVLTHKSGYDNQGTYISDMLAKNAFPIAYDAKEYVNKINNVTMNDIKEVLKIFKERKVIFGYGGDIDE